MTPTTVYASPSSVSVRPSASGAPPKWRLPESVAEDDDVAAVRRVFLGRNARPSNGSAPQHLEEAVAHRAGRDGSRRRRRRSA